MQAENASTTRRALFAVAAALPVIPALASAAPPNRWKDWVDGFGVVAKDPEMHALMTEAHRQGYRADQVTHIIFKERGVRRPSLRLTADDGDQIQIWRNCTLRCPGSRGEG